MGKTHIGLWLFVFLVFAANTAFSLQEKNQSNCTPLNAEMGKWFIENSSPSPNYQPVLSAAPIEKVLGAPRHQGNTGWCFAYTAAEMVSYKTGERASAASIARSHYFNGGIFTRMSNSRYGGHVNAALERSKKEGICSEASVSSQNYSPDNIKAAVCSNPSKAIQRYQVVGQSAYPRNGETLLPLIDRTLRDGGLAGISFQLGDYMLSKKSYYHAAVIVARVFNPKSARCEYIVRNSWGTENCMHLGRLSCIGGYFSLSERDIDASGKSVTILQ